MEYQISAQSLPFEGHMQLAFLVGFTRVVRPVVPAVSVRLALED